MFTCRWAAGAWSPRQMVGGWPGTATRWGERERVGLGVFGDVGQACSRSRPEWQAPHS